MAALHVLIPASLWHKQGVSAERRPPKPLDNAALERLALRYVERFATTRGKLIAYLRRKVRERGWAGEPGDAAALADRMVDLGYVNDRVFAEARVGALGRRGLGARRVAGALREAHVGEADSEALAPVIEGQAMAAALTFARRKRIGPYGRGEADRDVQQKQLAAMLRAGHDFALSRRIVACAPGDVPEEDA
ncbi:RecX family transcriptional regulator [Sphingomonas carotinifaciens]|uniref:regulatory protein RecX n=1 Tax=Sphingomonas carotinifaciens TaxID=1166323 RepID=UPI000DD74F12